MPERSAAGRGLRLGGQSGERFTVGRFGDAAFAEDGGNVFVWCDVESGMGGFDVGCDAYALDFRDFGRRAFFDRNVVAAGNRQIKCGNGRGDVERYIVLTREYGDLVRADFIGGVTVG